MATFVETNDTIFKLTEDAGEVYHSNTVQVSFDKIDNNTLKQIKYLKEVFAKVSINALQSKTFGPWIHLLEILSLLKPYHYFICKSKKCLHYILRIYQYVDTHPAIDKINVKQCLEETFLHINFEVASTRSISTINSRSTTRCSPSPPPPKRNDLRNDKIILSKAPVIYDEDVFNLKEDDLKDRVYEPKSLSLKDIQKSLPRVVYDLAKLESTWSNALGLTLTSINTNLPEEIIPEYISANQNSYNTSPAPSVLSSKEVKTKQKRPKTGREVVEHLVRTSQSSKVEIWYLNLVKTLRYEPYNLVVTSKRNANKEHVVISIFGVLYVKNNGKSEITALGQWYMEAVCFETMRNINFFKNFSLFKVLHNWKLNTKYKQFCKVKTNLSKLYLYNIPSIPLCLLEVRHLMVQFDSLSLIPTKIQKPITIEQLAALIGQQKNKFNKILSRLITKCQAIVKSCFIQCKEYYEYCLAQLQAIKNHMKASMAITRKQKEHQQRNLNSAIINLQRLNEFTKLVECMIRSQLICSITSQISNFIQVDVLSTKEFFYTSVEIFDNKDLIITPNTIELNTFIENTVLDTVGSVHSISKFNLPEYFESEIADQTMDSELDLQKLEIFLNNPVNKTRVTDSNNNECMNYEENIISPSIMESVIAQVSMVESFTLLDHELKRASVESQAVLESYWWLTEIAVFIYNWTTDIMHDWINQSASFIEKNMLQLKSWSEQVAQIANQEEYKHGILYIDCSNCKNILLPAIEKILAQFFTHLSKNNLKTSETLIKYLKEKVKTLSNPSTEVTDFTKFHVFINDMKDEVNEAHDKIDHMKAVFDVIKHCYRSLTIEEEKMEKQLLRVWEKFMFVLQTSKDHLSANTPTIIQKLKDLIQVLLEKCFSIIEQSTSGKYMDPNENMFVVVKELKMFWSKLHSLMEELQIYKNCYKTLTCEEIALKDLNDEEKKMYSRFELWKYLEVATHAIKEWKHSYLQKLNIGKVMEKVKEWKIACVNLHIYIPHDDGVLLQLKALIEDISCLLPVLRELSNPILLERHWKDIFTVLDHVYDSSVTYRVSDIIAMDVLENFHKIQQICLSACSENSLLVCLNKLIKCWQKKDFKFAKRIYDKKSNNHDLGFTLVGITELQFDVEDSLVTLQSMLVSPHVADVREVASFWSSQLQEIKEILNLWTVAQQEWLYLGNMFIGEEMQKNHKKEFKNLSETNNMFKDLMNLLMTDPKVINVLDKRSSIAAESWNEFQRDNLKQTLQQIILKQSSVIKQLEDYLSKIQDSFPRLYFLSKNQMLNLLAITRNPPALMPFVKSCFPGICNMKFELPVNSKVIFTLDATLNVHLLEATGFSGEYDEHIEFDQPLSPTVAPAVWFKAIEKQMKHCVRKDIFQVINSQDSFYSISESCIELEKENQFLCQSLLLSCEYKLSEMMERNFNKNELKKCLLAFQREIDYLSESLLNNRLLSCYGKTDQRRILLLQNLLLIMVHWKDLCQSLLLRNVQHEASFDWCKVIRYKVNETDQKILVECMGKILEYSHEYMFPSSALVMTPLHDKVFLSLFNAFYMKKIGGIYGEKNHGKSSTVKNMSQVLGRNLVVFNCSPDKSLECIKQFFFGAIPSGSLLCFENLHLLPMPVLSIIGEYCTCIHSALKNISNESNGVFEKPDEKVNSVDISNHIVPINSLYSCCVTMDTSYNQWSIIPDNLNENIHTASLATMDTVYIFEIWFLMNGFRTGKELAKKIQLFYDENHEYLSLSKISALIKATAQDMCHGSRKMDDPDKVVNEEMCMVSMMLKTFQLSTSYDIFKKLKQDIGIIFDEKLESSFEMKSDLFLIDSVKEQIKSDQLIPKNECINKVLDLHKILCSHQSVILLGQCATGKTTCYKTLSHALCQFYSPWSQKEQTQLKQDNFEQVNLNVIYPNVLSYDQLYGHIDESTSSWIDGLLTKMLRNINVAETPISNNQKQTKHIQQWFVLDGNISASWMLPFESLLDSSKQFVFGSGEKILTPSNLKVLFETDNIALASPSIISRSEILYFPCDQTVDWKCLFKSWKLNASTRYVLSSDSYNVIEEVMSYTLLPTVQFIDIECDKLFSSSKSSTVTVSSYVLKILSAVLLQWKSRDDIPNQANNKKIVINDSIGEEDGEKLTQFLCHAIAYSFVYGVSPLVHENSVSKLDVYVRQLFSTCPLCPVIFPALMLDCYFDGKTGELVKWNESKCDIRIPNSVSYIITKEVQQQIQLANLLLSAKENVLIVGGIASGKSVLVKQFLSAFHQIDKIQITPATTVEYFQDMLKERFKNIKKQQTANHKIGPSLTQKKYQAKFFIDDLNLCRNNTVATGDDSLTELIRQISAEDGFYDFHGKYFHHLSNIQLMVSYTPPCMDFVGSTYSNASLNNRLPRHFSVVRIPCMNKDQVQSLFTKQCKNWVDTLEWVPWKKAFSAVVTSATVNIHHAILAMPILLHESPHFVLTHHDLYKTFKLLYQFVPNDTVKLVEYLKNMSSSTVACKSSQPSFVSESISEFLKQTEDARENVNVDFLLKPFEEFMMYWCVIIKQMYGKKFHNVECIEAFHKIFECELKQTLLCDGSKNAQDGLLIFDQSFENENIYPEILMKTLHITEMSNCIFKPVFLNESATKMVCQRFQVKDFKSQLENVMCTLNMNVIMYDELLESVQNVCTIITSAVGHGVLISNGGHGRFITTKIAAHLYSMQLIELNWNKNESVITALKDACSLAGIKGKPVVLYVSEYITEDVMKHLIPILCGGSCNGLYSANEISLISGQLLPGNYSSKRKSESYGMQEKLFTRIKQNLKMIFAVDFNNSMDYFNKYPLLVHNTLFKQTYSQWSFGTLTAVALGWLSNHFKYDDDVMSCFDNAIRKKQDCLQRIAILFAKLYLKTKEYIQTCVSKDIFDTLISPLKLVESMHMFQVLYSLRIDKKKKELLHYQSAIQVTVQANTSIENMETNITALQPLLTAAQITVTSDEIKMKESQAEFLSVKQQCKDQLDKIEELRKPCEFLRNETQRDFEKISSSYNATLTAVNAISHVTIDELKSYHHPPALVKDVLGMLCIMFNTPEEWKEEKLLLMKDNFLHDLQSYDKDNIPEIIFKKLSQFLTNESINGESLQQVSVAAYNLFLWIQGIHSYGTIKRQLQPKKDLLKQSEINIEKAERELGEKKVQYTNAKKDLEDIIDQYKDNVKKSKSLEKEIQELQSSKKYAIDLSNTMEVFTVEWLNQIREIEYDIESAIVDSIFASVQIVYSLYLNESHRDNLLKKFKDICEESDMFNLSSHFKLDDMLGYQNEKKTCFKLLKSRDDVVFENAISARALSYSGKCLPLFIDPCDSIEKWLHVIESNCRDTILNDDNEETDLNSQDSAMYLQVPSNLLVINANDERIDDILHEAITSSTPVLIKHLERSCNSRKVKQIILDYEVREQSTEPVTIGSYSVTSTNRFRLYLSSTIPLHDLLHDSVLPLLNTVPIYIHSSCHGLKWKLLETTLCIEKNELNCKQRKISADVEFIKDQQKVITDKILEKVLSSERSLLDEENILEYMSFNKESYWLTQEKLSECQRSSDNSLSQVNDYKLLAEFGVIVYATLRKLCSINSLYFFSLETFLQIFRDTLHESQATKAASSCIIVRMDEIKVLLMEKVYCRLSVSMSKEDLIFFPLLVLFEEMSKSKSLSADELNMFILSLHGCHNDDVIDSKLDRPEWISMESWRRFSMLSRKISCFNGLTKSLIDHPDEWKEFFKLQPMLALPPSIRLLDINKLQLALLWLAYDTTLMFTVSRELVLCKLGPKFISPPMFNIDYGYSISESYLLNMVVLPTDDKRLVIDPVVVLTRLSEENNISSLTKLSMGNKDQLSNIYTELENTILSDGWIVLENCHVLQKWPVEFITKIQMVLENQRKIKTPNKGNKFRIWLILRDSNNNNLPSSLIQQSVSIRWQFSMENIKNKIKRFYGEYFNDDSSISDCLMNTLCQRLERNGNDCCQYSISYEIDRLIFQKDFYIKQRKISSSQHDTCVLNDGVDNLSVHDMNMEIKKTDKVGNGKSSMTSDVIFHTLQKVYAILPNKELVCNLSIITELMESLKSIREENMSLVYLNCNGKSLITSFVSTELRITSNMVEMFIKDLKKIQDISQNKSPPEEKSMTLWKKVSSDVTPNCWLADNLNEWSTLSTYIKYTREKLIYLKLLLEKSSPTVFDLKYFNNISGFIQAVKLQLALNVQRKPAKLHYYAELLPSDAEPSTSNILRNEVYFQNLSFYLGSSDFKTIPYVRYKIQKELGDGDFMVDIYESNQSRKIVSTLNCQPMVSLQDMQNVLFAVVKI